MLVAAPPSPWVPTGRDVLLGFALHVVLGGLLGFGSILPIDFLQFPLFAGGEYAPVLDAYGWELVILAVIIPYLCRQDLAGREALWIERIDWSLVAVLAIGAYMLILLSDLAIEALLPTPGSTPDDGISADLNDLRDTPFGFALFAACISFVGPIVEEVVFRGLLFAHIRARLGALPTIAITGALFGLLHGGPPSYAASIVATGLILGVLREWTGGIVAPTAAHVLNNLIATLADL
jgi:membrane protease YdiL (CAAX protease family)